jgi:hypothetical protein
MNRLFSSDDMKEAYRRGKNAEAEWTFNQWLAYAKVQRAKKRNTKDSR